MTRPKTPKPKKTSLPVPVNGDHVYSKKKSGNFNVLVDKDDSDNESSGSEERIPCFGCKEPFETRREDGICCNFCEHWFCLSCSKLKKVVYQALIKSPESLMWFCQHCLTAFPGVKKMMLHMVGLDDRVDKLESRVDKLEQLPRDSTTRDSPKNLEAVVRDEIREIQDIDSRKLNMVCFNLDESKQENVEDKKMEDMQNLQKLINDDMQVKEIHISNPVRLGEIDQRKESDKRSSRPLKFSVDTFESKRKILMGNAKLRKNESVSENKPKIFITPDLTKKQRDEAYRLREELRYRRNVLHEENLKISRGKIVTVGNNNSYRGSGRYSDDGRQTHGDAGLGGRYGDERRQLRGDGGWGGPYSDERRQPQGDGGGFHSRTYTSSSRGSPHQGLFREEH